MNEKKIFTISFLISFIMTIFLSTTLSAKAHSSIEVENNKHRTDRISQLEDAIYELQDRVYELENRNTNRRSKRIVYCICEPGSNGSSALTAYFNDDSSKIIDWGVGRNYKYRREDCRENLRKEKQCR